MKENIVETKSFQFAVSNVNLYKELTQKKEFVLSKQLLRSSTSVGANIRESCNSGSKKDFIYKLSISQKECDESIYWLELYMRLIILIKSNLLPCQIRQMKFYEY